MDALVVVDLVATAGLVALAIAAWGRRHRRARWRALIEKLQGMLDVALAASPEDVLAEATRIASELPDITRDLQATRHHPATTAALINRIARTVRSDARLPEDEESS